MPFLRRLVAPVLSLAIIGSTLLPGCGAPQSYRWESERAAEYRVGPGDKLRISVWKHDEVSQEAHVRPDGGITIPLIGEIRAAGRSPTEIAADIGGRLAKFYADAPPVTVAVLEVKSYRVYVVGEVQKGGEFTPSQPVTVLMAIAMSGGFTPYASKDSIVIVRRAEGVERRIPFSWSAVVREGELRQNLVLQSGDTIVVP